MKNTFFGGDKAYKSNGQSCRMKKMRSRYSKKIVYRVRDMLMNVKVLREYATWKRKSNYFHCDLV